MADHERLGIDVYKRQVDARGNRTCDSLPGERDRTGSKQWFPVELGGVRGDRDLYYFAGDGDSCRIADRFIIDLSLIHISII